MPRAVLTCVLLACLPALAQTEAPERALALELPVVERTFENGLRVLVLEDHSIPNATLYVGWRVGSRNERPGITGLAHFFEHMMFSGGARFGGGRFDPVMEAAGGSNNAYTSNDVTVYMDWFPASRLDLILDMEADRMRAMRFDPRLVETERGVVASERRLTVEDPAELLREELWAAAYTAHPYQWPVLGWMSDIQGWTQEDLETFFRTHYTPNNCVLVLVGDVEAERALEAIASRLGDLPRGPERPPLHTFEPPQRGPRTVVVEDPSALLPLLMLAWHIPATDHPDFPALVVVERLLLGGESSRLDRALIQEEELCLELAGGWQGYQFDPSLFTVDLVLRQGAEPAQAEARLCEELTQLTEEGPTPPELEKAKRSYLVDKLAELRTIDGKANLLMDTELFFGGWRRLPARLAAVEAVTTEDVQRVLRRYFVTRNMTQAILRPSRDAQPVAIEHDAPEREPAALPEPPPQPALPEIGPLAARPLRLPTPRRLELENGIRVLLVPDHEVPLVTFQARLEGGAHEDPAGQEGLCQVLAGAILRGAGERDATALQEAVENAGGELTAIAEPRWLELNGEFLARDAGLGLELIVDVLRRPLLDPDEVEHELGIQLAEVDALREEPSRALETYWRCLHFEGHPFGRPLNGDESSLDAITHEQVQAAARRQLRPERLWLTVAGDFDPDLLASRLQELLGDWSADPRPATPVAPPPVHEGHRVLLVDAADSLQTYFQFGGPVFPWSDPAYPARVVANTVFGGRFTSRLNTALRIESGLTYGAYSKIDDALAGTLSASSYTAVASGPEAIQLARDVYQRFRSGGISQAELDSARSYLQGQLAPELLETAPQQAELLLELELHGLPRERIEQLFDQLDALTLEQVNEVITTRFPARLSWVLIGPAQGLRPLANALGEVRELSLSDPGFAPRGE